MAQSEPNPYRRSLLRQERSRQTRDALVHATLGLWHERGFDETTVDDISAAAGVARSTYYFHFADKETLLQAVAGMSAAAIGGAVTDARAEEQSLDDGLRIFAFELARHVERLPRDLVGRITRSVIGGISGLGESRGNGSGFDGQLQGIFDAARDDLAPGTDRTELAAIAAGMVMEGILRWASGATGARSLEDVIAERMALIAHGARRA